MASQTAPANPRFFELLHKGLTTAEAAGATGLTLEEAQTLIKVSREDSFSRITTGTALSFLRKQTDWITVRNLFRWTSLGYDIKKQDRKEFIENLVTDGLVEVKSIKPVRGPACLWIRVQP